MKARILSTLVIPMAVAIGSNSLAQSMMTASKPKSICIGLTAGHYHYDPAVGFEITTPRLINSELRLRVKVNHTWSEDYKITNDRWNAFNTYWAGLVYSTPTFDRGKLFLEAGSYTIRPDKLLNSKKIRPGYYGAIGVELFLPRNQRERISYFFSGGIASIYARSERNENRPRYGTGIIFTNGFRYYFN